MKLLHVDSSILGDQSVTRRLTAAVVEEWRRQVPDLEVRYRDLAAGPLDHLSGALIAARAGGAEAADEAVARDVALSEEVLEEFLDADVVVVGAPMYNFSISSQLKAWIDRIATQGRTFRYTAEGPVGLAGGKRVVVVSGRGGFYGTGTPLAAIDHQEPYLRAVFAFFGIEDVEYLRAEGVAVAPEQRARSLQEAEQAVPQLVSRSAAALLAA